MTGRHWILWLAGLALPFGAALLHQIAGVVCGVALPVLWLATMIGTCMGGAFIAFPMAMAQAGAGLGWLLAAIRMLVA